MAEKEKYYKVVVRKRVPYFTVFFYWIFIFFTACFMLVYIVMYPTKYAPAEMAFAYYEILLPEVIKKFIVFSTAGLFISCLLYLNVRLYKNAIVRFDSNQIIIRGRSINLAINVSNIKKVTIMDESTEVGGQLKEKFMVYFEQRMQKSIRIRLLYYYRRRSFRMSFSNTNI